MSQLPRKMESSNNKEAEWIPLPTYPANLSNGKHLLRLLSINGDEFVALNAKAKRGQINKDVGAVYMYNVKSDTWTRLINANNDINVNQLSVTSAAFNQSKQSLYFCGRHMSNNDPSKIYEFNLESKSLKLLTEGTVPTALISVIYASDHVHVLGCNGCYLEQGKKSEHIIINIETGKIVKRHCLSIDSLSLIIGWRDSIFLKSQNCLFTFGSSGTVEKYNIHSRERETTDIEFPRPKRDQQGRTSAALVSSTNEQHLLSIGAMKKRFNSIQVYDFEKNVLNLSKIKRPSATNDFRVISMSNKMRDELLVFGFVCQCFASSEFQNIQRLPHYLIRQIAEWICNEYVHLIEKQTGRHWKIHIDKLFEFQELKKSETKIKK